jgi:hypothetical protein
MTMTLNLYSLSVFLLASLLGLWAHWLKKRARKEVTGKFIDYLIADYPGRSLGTGFVLMGAAFTAVQTGAADAIDMRLIWATLKQGNLYLPTFNALAGAFTLGWAVDSAINKGEK